LYHSTLTVLCVLIQIVVVLLGLFSSFQRHCQPLHWRPQYASSQNSMFPRFDRYLLEYFGLRNVLDQPSVGSAKVPALVFCVFQLMFAAIT
jgi:ammonia channel protein AmtB